MTRATRARTSSGYGIDDGQADSNDGILVVDDFLSPADCAHMLEEQAHGEWIDSVVANASGGAMRGGGRYSDSLVLSGYSGRADALLRRIERRLAQLAGIRPAHLEPWQMTRYRRGERYDYHVDCGIRHPSGERMRTILIVLEQPACGGATHFRALGRTVRPCAGRLVVWSNLLPNGRCNHAMIHAGRPVWQGRKTILTTWEHVRPYPDP